MPGLGQHGLVQSCSGVADAEENPNSAVVLAQGPAGAGAAGSVAGVPEAPCPPGAARECQFDVSPVPVGSKALPRHQNQYKCLLQRHVAAF